MRKLWGLALTMLLAGCSLGPATGVEGLIQQVRRDVKTSVDLIAKVELQSGGAIGIYAYKKGNICGAGVADTAGNSTMQQEGACTDPISAGQTEGDTLKVVYGYLPEAPVGKILLHWEDGTEAEAQLGESAFYYVAEGSNLPKGQVSLTAYDREGKVLQEAPAPGQHKHGH